MLLINFLGLIATLTLVSGGDDVGTPGVDDFDFPEAKGTWYVLKHTSNDFENQFDCVVVNYGPPEGNVSLITKQAKVISTQSPITANGSATNWNDTGFDENYQPPNIWNGRYDVIAIEYECYVILKHYPADSNQTYIYVAYRCQEPDKETKDRVQKKLQDDNINATQLVDWPANNCQQAQPPTKGRCCAKRRNRKD